MKVKLVSTTKSLITEMELSPEELIIYIARVSNPSNQLNTLTSDGLMKFCIKNKHWSVFDMVDLTVEIKTSRAIAQQILRHRSFCFQEFSQRYSVVAEMEKVQLRLQADKNRQSSTDELDYEDFIYFNMRCQKVINLANHVYNEMIDRKVAKECARMILPLTTQTTIYMKGSVRSWIHYLSVRLDEHTQLEHRQVALEIDKIFLEVFPNIHKAINHES